MAAGARVLSSPKGRACQMNAGAAAATGALVGTACKGQHLTPGCSTGELLCFVHADSQPPAALVSVVRQTLSDPVAVLGGFRVLISAPDGSIMRFQTAHQYAKTFYMPALFMPLRFAR